ncbi:hypothetical protein [Solibacillus daqui]|uniref:hypothetical protein n=1 Tax=Solibacillus daqui TaxID=2912187 RepID=UPI00236634F5|nr:hypothetical protein [Solibacillus daqui]
MTLFLTRYFLRELSAWVWITPLALIPFLLIGAATGLPFYFSLLLIIYSCSVVFSKYNELRSKYSTTLAVAPLPSKMIVQTDFAFLGWVALCYVSYALGAITVLTLLIEKEFIFPTVHQLGFIIACCLALIALNIGILTLNIAPMNTFMITIFLLSMLFNEINLTLFASSYGLHFFFLMLVITSLSYFSMTSLGKRRGAFKC